MSREIFEIVQGMDLKNIETQLALQCAPLITGLKISNMLIVSNEDEKLVRAILKRTGISCYRLLQNEKKITLLLFRRNQLEKFLEREDVSEVLREEGYVEIQLGRILSIFQMRYRAYMNGSKIFPHEMGLLLGYPVEDVTGFMVHGGKNSLYSGYWKVYADVPAKKHIFTRYDEARETLIRLLANDIGIRLIFEIYRDESIKEIAV